MSVLHSFLSLAIVADALFKTNVSSFINLAAHVLVDLQGY